MRRLAVLIPLLFVSSVLHSAVFSSNLLCQRLGQLDAIPAKGYAIETYGDTETLYLDGKPVRTVSRTSEGNEYLITETDLTNGSVQTRLYQGGVLVLETSSDGTSVKETSYGYIDGHLAFCSFVENGETSDVLFFLRSSDGSSPVAVKDSSGLRFMSDSYMYQSGELYQIIAPDLILTGDYEIMADGCIYVETGGISYTYSPDGLLRTAEESSSLTTYFYEGRTIVRSETEKGSDKRVELYSGGNRTGIQTYENGELVSSIQCLEGGNVETLYRNGKELAVVYYKPDNRTVDRIEYR